VDNGHAQLHRRQDGQDAFLLTPRAIAVAAVVALIASASAGATTPAAALAKGLKTDMQRNYDQHHVGFVFTTVTCKIAANGATARCQAHFTSKGAGLIGVIQVNVTSNASGAGVQYNPVSIACKDSKTGKAVKC
jgi:hypothetical protein